MPGDTLIKGAVHIIESIDTGIGPPPPEEILPQQPHYVLPELVMFLIASAFVIFWLVYVVFLPGWLEAGRRKKLVKALLAENTMIYQDLLGRYNPYYSSLPDDLKERFLIRTINFMVSKEFRFHSLIEEEKIKVLVSAAAVQLTFGLRNYLLDYFDNIHIMSRDYYISNDPDLYYGHVSKGGIHVAWNRFQEGYENYNDSVNVGLHEMAHALSYDLYLDSNGTADKLTRERMNTFCVDCRDNFRGLKAGDNHLLSSYGATNFDEFWAVCVETFFENSKGFKEKMPQLYDEVSRLLNQDPMLPRKILISSLA